MGLFLERGKPGDHFVEHRSEGKLVRTKIDFAAGHLLRRHVADGAHHRSMLGDSGGRIRTPGVVELKKFRQTEIQHLGRTVARNHQVLRLEIAMNDANLVRFGETVGNLRRDCDRLAKWNRARGEQRTHRFSIHQFHCDIARAVYVSEFINRHNVRVIKRAGGTGFLLEAR